jgi:site-specific DNA-cytosine methylase
MQGEFTHASIVPLIGGETLGAHAAHGRAPEYFLSYSPFQGNDQHILNYYKSKYESDIPYILLDQGGVHPYAVDVVHSVCPCAGLSMLSHGYGDHNPNNRWMAESTEYVLTNMKPRVLWGENAPGFAGKVGDTVRNNLKRIGKENGYTMTVYRTRSLLHGIPQVRERSFYFFWRDDKVPMLNYYNRPYTPIEELLTNISSNFQTDPINKKTPSVDDPYYRYILEELEGGITHAQFAQQIPAESARNADVLAYIETKTNYLEVAKWMEAKGYEKEVAKCKYRHEKLAAGGSIMRRNTIVPRDYIGAFVGHYPVMLAHPTQDRYINYREAMTIMGMPQDFELVGASPRNANMICQNVPVQTATDMATEVVAYLKGERKMLDTDYIVQYNHSQICTYEEKASLEAFLA